MEDSKFIHLFHKFMKDPKAKEKKQILCEKALMLWNLGNCFALQLFMELLEDEEARDILNHKYQVDLNEFYSMNKKPLYIDPGFSV